MKKYYLVIGIIVFYCGAVILNAQSNENKSNEEKLSISDRYLGLDCSVSDRPQNYLAQLKKDSEAATAYFIAVFEKGLSAKVKKELESEFNQLFESRNTYLSSEQGKITIEDAEGNKKSWTPNKVSASEFVKNQMSSYEDQLQVRAIESLVALNTKTGNQFLKRLLNNPDFKFQQLIEELLQ